MQHESVQSRFGTTQLATGLEVHYAEQGDPSGEPIIFLHGYSDSWYSFSRVLPLLPPTYHAYAFDQRGHGNSGRPTCCYTMNDLANDVVAFMDALGIAEATIAGHSMGSFIAQGVALSHPQRVKRLMLIGSATTAVNEGITELHDFVKTLDDPVPSEFVEDFQKSTIYHEVPKEFLETIVSESLKLPARVWKDALSGLMECNYADQLHQLTMPTLIFWGTEDTIFFREEQDQLAALIPQATLKIYSDTGHALHWERPQQFAQDLRTFL
ncbi:MAG: alpha/beta hydrolase [Chloroflexi bacterium AL-W]|nr:alpha/beta hydrolase [Chloroflexi bacterium AL-N1]NOK69932.1 alpha/beta hydrolase [Chloroflexi bacterium AL-N10]NOK73772.1 alpha/beta hydrolase [Chloroflexi bacterium AL-N5]NOK85464.1 alpha/beta hydrolase [Chloroflexi bacterium AL-W]NOK91665.1 alpha/beta hydrolase [Chloroflexi bacterium AL-N15]